MGNYQGAGRVSWCLRSIDGVLVKKVVQGSRVDATKRVLGAADARAFLPRPVIMTTNVGTTQATSKAETTLDVFSFTAP
jgi:hypothetical protein